MGEWIRVDDKIMPKDGQKVLAYWPHRVHLESAYEECIATTFYWNDEGFWPHGEIWNGNPTHWMPLPDPPKQEGSQ